MDEIGDIDGLEDFSMDDLEKDLKKGRGGRRWLWLLIGIGVGVAGTIAAPIYLSDYLPDSLRGSREILSGPVMAEEVSDGRVLLTIDAEPGALIASFSQRVDEIALLVDPGDIVTIGVEDYEPFVEDPDFEGVKKADEAASSSGGSEEREGDDPTGEEELEGDADAALEEQEGDSPETEGDVEGDDAEGAVVEGDSAAADTTGSGRP